MSWLKIKLVSTQYSLDNMAFELYVSGCKEHPCKGCYSPELWDDSIGEDINYAKLKNNIEPKLSIIKNIYILGGEPLEKEKTEVLELLKFLKQFNVPIWLFTRFKLKEVDKEVLDLVDYIKCGQYDNTKLKQVTYYGVTLASSNQVIYKLK